MHDSYDEIKRKLRKLKKLENKIRFFDANCPGSSLGSLTKSQNAQNTDFVWDEFFDLHEGYHGKARYTLDMLVMMDKEEYKSVINEYFYHLYYRLYKENGFINIQLFDPDILAQMDLPAGADIKEIKKKFRELAKKYHPDVGGDSDKFIELMDMYKKLID